MCKLDTFAHLTHFELLTVIVNYGQGSKVLGKIAKEQGVKGGTVLTAKGTYRKPILKGVFPFLELTDVRKEVVDDYTLSFSE